MILEFIVQENLKTNLFISTYPTYIGYSIECAVLNIAYVLKVIRWFITITSQNEKCYSAIRKNAVSGLKRKLPVFY